MYHKYVELRKHNVLPMIIHFRIATSGRIDEDNCHPFQVTPDIVMAHNGILDNAEPTSTISDTRVFIGEVLSDLPEGFLWNYGIQRLISGFIGDSKLVFLDRYGMYRFVNENLGHWDKHHSNWFSNYSYAMPDTDTLYWDRKCRKGQFDPFRSHWNRPLWEDDHWGVCESCENWVEYTDLEYDSYLNVAICNNCKSYYYENEERCLVP